MDYFPGPLRIGLSIPRLLALIAIGGLFIAVGIWFIQYARAIAAVSLRPPGAPPFFLRLLISFGAARDMPQAVVELGWVSVIFGGAGFLRLTISIIRSVSGSRGLILDREGFTQKTPKGNHRHNWADVGDFGTLELPKITRRRLGLPFSKSRVIFNDYLAPESPVAWLRQAGRNRAMVGSYAYAPEVLATAMSIWREWALKIKRSKAGTDADGHH